MRVHHRMQLYGKTELVIKILPLSIFIRWDNACLVSFLFLSSLPCPKQCIFTSAVAVHSSGDSYSYLQSAVLLISESASSQSLRLHDSSFKLLGCDNSNLFLMSPRPQRVSFFLPFVPPWYSSAVLTESHVQTAPVLEMFVTASPDCK